MCKPRLAIARRYLPGGHVAPGDCSTYPDLAATYNAAGETRQVLDKFQTGKTPALGRAGAFPIIRAGDWEFVGGARTISNYNIWETFLGQLR